MNTKRAGERARVGFYFNLRSWELTLHRADGGALPGQDNDRYLRVPAVALLVLGPMMGFLFVIFLPLIGFALTFRELGHRVAGLFTRKAQAQSDAKTATR